MQLACSSQSYEDALDGGLSLTEWLRFVAEELGLAGVELEDKHIGVPTEERLAGLRTASKMSVTSADVCTKPR